MKLKKRKKRKDRRIKTSRSSNISCTHADDTDTNHNFDDTGAATNVSNTTTTATITRTASSKSPPSSLDHNENSDNYIIIASLKSNDNKNKKADGGGNHVSSTKLSKLEDDWNKQQQLQLNSCSSNSRISGVPIIDTISSKILRKQSISMIAAAGEDKAQRKKLTKKKKRRRSTTPIVDEEDEDTNLGTTASKHSTRTIEEDEEEEIMPSKKRRYTKPFSSDDSSLNDHESNFKITKLEDDNDEDTKEKSKKRKKKNKKATKPEESKKIFLADDNDGGNTKDTVSPLPEFPFPVEADDHCESPINAYADIVPFLEMLEEIHFGTKINKNPCSSAQSNGATTSTITTTTPSSTSNSNFQLHIYDPYYCDGAMKRNLTQLGFKNVYHEKKDCYEVWNCRDRYPDPLDVFITNPPYSSDHIERLIEHIASKHNNQLSSNKKPVAWFLLLPTWVHKKEYFIKAMTNANIPVFYLVPRKRYVYVPPTNFRESKKSDVHKKSSPFVSMWYCYGGSKSVNDLLIQQYSTQQQVTCDLARTKNALRDMRRKNR